MLMNLIDFKVSRSKVKGMVIKIIYKKGAYVFYKHSFTLKLIISLLDYWNANVIHFFNFCFCWPINHVTF